MNYWSGEGILYLVPFSFPFDNLPHCTAQSLYPPTPRYVEVDQQLYTPLFISGVEFECPESRRVRVRVKQIVGVVVLVRVRVHGQRFEHRVRKVREVPVLRSGRKEISSDIDSGACIRKVGGLHLLYQEICQHGLQSVSCSECFCLWQVIH